MIVGKNINLSHLQLALIKTVVETALTRQCPMKIELKGESENYLVCEVAGLRVYLYSDGFDVVGKETKLIVETDDIETMEQAQKKLKTALKSQN